MRCKKEEFVEEAIFHIYNHSVNEIDLFFEDDDYTYFLSKFKKNLNHKEFEIYAYCLMPNHFHFCIKQNLGKPIYEIFNKTCISYVHHFNSKYKRKGKLFANKLQHKKVKRDDYLIQLCKYIHYNPVKAGLVEKLKNWEFSNYLEYINQRDGTLFSQELISMYPDEFKNYEERIIEYKKYLDEEQFKEILF